MKRAAVLLLMFILIAGSFIPLRWKVWLGAHGQYHQRAHFLAFFLCDLAFCAFARTARTRVLRSLGLVLLALGIEAAQSTFLGDIFEVGDLAMDAAGTGFGLLVAHLWASRHHRVPR